MRMPMVSLSLALLCMTVGVASAMAPEAPDGRPTQPQSVYAWLPYEEGTWLQTKARLQAMGEQFKTSWEMFETLKGAAKGGQRLTQQDLVQPTYDWAGLWTRSRGGLGYDPDLPNGSPPTSAKLTPAGAAIVKAKQEQLANNGGEYDPLSDCRPAGMPRWFTEPVLNEYIVTPKQALLINEMNNEVRRVYTDGRGHPAGDEAYPSWEGDTIGFWDNGTLVAHTQDLHSGQYQRGPQPNYSEQVSIVERWRKVDARNIQVDVWVFDPENLAQPWYTRQHYGLIPNDEFLLRIRYWDCRENSNNEIVTTETGTSQYRDFTFDRDSQTGSPPATQP